MFQDYVTFQDKPLLVTKDEFDVLRGKKSPEDLGWSHIAEKKERLYESPSGKVLTFGPSRFAVFGDVLVLLNRLDEGDDLIVFRPSAIEVKVV